MFQRMVVKWSICKQIIIRAGNSSKNESYKKFRRTVYFFAQKRFAIRENFEDVVDYLMDLGDVDI